MRHAPVTYELSITAEILLGGEFRVKVLRVRGFVPLQGVLTVNGSVPVSGTMLMKGEVPVVGSMPVHGTIPVNAEIPISGHTPIAHSFQLSHAGALVRRSVKSKVRDSHIPQAQ